jgi:hypothetical protein
MVPIIRELNAKGYKTKWCCAGHPEEEDSSHAIYISFAEEYDFDEPFPAGGKYSKAWHKIEYIPSVEGYESLVKFQTDILYKLQDWAEMLLGVNFWEDCDEEDED